MSQNQSSMTLNWNTHLSMSHFQKNFFVKCNKPQIKVMLIYLIQCLRRPVDKVFSNFDFIFFLISNTWENTWLYSYKRWGPYHVQYHWHPLAD